jgi:hypothetical protein
VPDPTRTSSRLSGVRANFQRLIDPYPAPPFVPNQLYSTGDVLAERHGVVMVENLFHASGSVARLVRAHVRFLQDAEAERALKKDFHGVVETRARHVALRLDSPSAHGFSEIGLSEVSHPLDHMIYAELRKFSTYFDGRIEFRLPKFPRARLLMSIFLAGSHTVLSALMTALFQSARKIEQKRARLAAPNFGDEALWRGIRAAAAEQGVPEGCDLAIVCERTNGRPVPKIGFRVLDLAMMKVPLGRWIYQVLWPTIRHSVMIMLFAASRPTDVTALVVARIALRQSQQAQQAWCIAFNLSFDHYMDNIEYTAQHIIKGIIFRKFGSRIIRWSHSDMDSFGVSLSYLGYDTFFSAGSYPAETFGSTWWPECRTVSIGHVMNDRRIRQPVKEANDEYRQMIDRRLSEGQKMVVFFGPSEVPGVDKVVRSVITAIKKVVEKRDDCFFVIKPKLSDRMWSFIHADTDLSDIENHPDVICIHYSGDGREHCPSSWLMQKMTCGSGGIGTTLTEALSLEMPYLTYFPVVADTPRLEILKRCGVMHDNLSSLSSALEVILEAPDSYQVPFEWFHQRFDHFRDDQALTRFAEDVFSTPLSELPGQNCQIRTVPSTK